MAARGRFVVWLFALAGRGHTRFRAHQRWVRLPQRLLYFLVRAGVPSNRGLP